VRCNPPFRGVLAFFLFGNEKGSGSFRGAGPLSSQSNKGREGTSALPLPQSKKSIIPPARNEPKMIFKKEGEKSQPEENRKPHRNLAQEKKSIVRGGGGGGGGGG